VRLRLQSPDGMATPLVRRIRLDFPRATSIDLLPAIYRADADAADFTARFLALFDASIAELDAAIDRAPALLDAGGVPDDVLPWLGSFLGLVFDPAWDPQRRRAILEAVPELYRLRGTPAGLKLAFRLVFDVEPVLQERGPQRPWGALNQGAALGAFRLFGRNRTRARLGRAVLGQAVIKSWGDPVRDPLDALAYRVQVLLPPAPRPRDAARVQALIDSQKPAHVLASLRTGGSGFVVGANAAIGIDTGFMPLPAPVLGLGGTIRLSRASVLRRGRRGSSAIPPGSVVVGQQPLTE
jgi:phage tail-like protein